MEWGLCGWANCFAILIIKCGGHFGLNMVLRFGQFSLRSLFEYWHTHWLADSKVADGQVGHGKV